MAGETLRVATFNLKHGAPQTEYKGDPDLVVQACTDLNADIIALQEVDVRVIRSRFANLAQVVAKATGMEALFSPTMRYGTGFYGNALLINGEVESSQTLDLGSGRRHRLQFAGRSIDIGHEPRNAIVTHATVRGRRLTLAATHLALEKALSKRQLAQTVDALVQSDDPQILLGDFNLTRSLVTRECLVDPFVLAQGPPTIPADHPKRQIDHIAVNGLTINHVEALHMPISDHRALVAEVE